MKRLIIISLLLTTNLTHSQEPITVGNKFRIDSGLLNEEREIWIGLPTNYDSTLSYPTLYVLDAEWQFDITLSVTKDLASNGKIPEHIVVGIPKIDGLHRFKDLTFTDTKVGDDGRPDPTIAALFNSEKTGGGNLFLSHLKDEVHPFIEKRFNLNGFDIFIGHSLSGYFGAYILTVETHFDAYQLYDPSFWYNNGDVIYHFNSTVDTGFQTNVFISTAQGGKERFLFHEYMHDSLNNTLIEKGINSKRKVYPNETHGSIRLPSLIDGLTNLYSGYDIGYILPTDTISAEQAEKHFQSFSKKVNYAFTCPVDVYRWVGYANYSQGKWNEAIKAYKKTFPVFEKDLNVIKELAECYFQIQNYKLSLTNYKKAYVLENSDESVLKRLDELKLLTTKNKQH